MDGGATTILLDPAIRDWVLLPIMLVMLEIGVLRHYVTQLLGIGGPPTQTALTAGSVPKSPTDSLKTIRESQALVKCRSLRQFGGNLPPAVFQQRRKEFAKRMAAGEFLKQQQPSSSSSSDQQQQQQQQQQPGIDQQTAQMELMMDGMKKNMAAMLPQMVLMGWVNFVFAGFLLIRLPFPLTVRFKAMLQRGIETREMGVEWVSSLSWYFLNLFGLRGVFGLLLGENNAAGGMADMQHMAGPAAQQQQQPGATPPDLGKLFASEREALELVEHRWLLEDAEQKAIMRLSALMQQANGNQEKLKSA